MNESSYFKPQEKPKGYYSGDHPDYEPLLKKEDNIDQPLIGRELYKKQLEELYFKKNILFKRILRLIENKLSSEEKVENLKIIYSLLQRKIPKNKSERFISQITRLLEENLDPVGLQKKIKKRSDNKKDTENAKRMIATIEKLIQKTMDSFLLTLEDIAILEKELENNNQ